MTRTHVVPVARLGRIVLENTTVGANYSVRSHAREIRQVTACRYIERETVNIQSAASHVLIHTVFKYGQRTQEGVIAAGYSQICLCRGSATATGYAAAVYVVAAVKGEPEVDPCAVAASRNKEAVTKSEEWIDVA